MDIYSISYTYFKFIFLSINLKLKILILTKIFFKRQDNDNGDFSMERN